MVTLGLESEVIEVGLGAIGFELAKSDQGREDVILLGVRQLGR